MGRDIRYCQICQHRKHTKMDGITCKRGLNHYSGRCERFLEDEIAREERIKEFIAERDRLPNAITAIQCTLFIVFLALMAGAYLGDYKLSHFLTYFFAAILIGLSGAAGAWGIDKYFKNIERRREDQRLTLDGIAQHIIQKGYIPRVSNNDVKFKIEGREYLIQDYGDGRIIIRTDYRFIPPESTLKAQTAAYEASYETFMAKIVIFRVNTSTIKQAEISVQLHCESMKDFEQNFDKYIAYINSAYMSFDSKFNNQ